ncbi:MAG: LysM peptidoglycan-binding domain-containing protein [Pseudomonadota bacterium]
MKTRGKIATGLAVVLAAVAALAFLSGAFGPGSREADTADPFGRDAGEPRPSVAEAGRSAPSGLPSDFASELALAPSAEGGAADAPPSAAAAAIERDPESTLIDLDTNRPDAAPDLPRAAGALEDPETAAEAAALEFNRAGPADAALSNARRAADAGVGALASPDEAARDERSNAEIRPEFDVVRVAKDGSAVLAGRAAPGAVVDVLIDGAPTETVRANVDGEFVALIAAPDSPSRPGAGRRIDLSARNPDGSVLDSVAPVVVAAAPAPEQAPVAVRPSEEAMEILQPPAARGEAGRVTIDSVTYGETGSVTVSGRGRPGELARLYLDNALEAEAKVTPEGDWRARITRSIEPAVYDLRVDQTTTAGVVTSRAATPFERVDQADIRLEKGAVVVQPGNNLWRIADYLYGDGARYTVIYGANRRQIRDPDLIYPGQVLNLPERGAEGAPRGG